MLPIFTACAYFPVVHMGVQNAEQATRALQHLIVALH